MLKKRIICTVLSLLMLLVLLPAIDTAKADATLITGFTLQASKFKTPKAGDPLVFPSDKVTVTSTSPAGLESALQIDTSWYDEVHCTSYYPSSEGAVFTPGEWTLYVYVDTVSSAYEIDYDNERFNSGGDLSVITLGGKEFRIGARGSSYIGYYTTFEVSSEGVAPMFVPDTFSDTVNNGDTYEVDLLGTGEAPITYSKKSGTLPPGIKLSSAGVLSGTFTTPGTYSFQVKATNAIGSTVLPCEITVRDVTRIKAFTLSASQDIPTPVIGNKVYFPSDYITVASTIPAGNESGLKINSYWYNYATGEYYYPSTSSGKKFTEGEWILYIDVDVVNDHYVIDYDEYFSGGSLSKIMLGGQRFYTNGLGTSYILYSTDFYLGTTPETINLKYSTSEYDLPYISDRMTGADVYQTFRRSIISRRGPCYYECYSGNESNGWYVDTDSGYTGFSDDPGDPAYLNESEELLVPQDPYYITFDVGLAPGCQWHPDQKFTVNGDDNTIIEAPYLDEDGIEHVWVSYMLMSREDLSDAEICGVEPMTCTGSPLTQANLQVVCNGELLHEGTHYVVSYENNVDPGYADIHIYGVNNYCGSAYHYFRIFDSDHPHEVIDTLTATSNIDEFLFYGGQICAPEFTITSGEPGYFETGMGGWYNLIDGEWVLIRSGQFTSGQWMYSCQIRIDEGGDRYSFSYRPYVAVDGTEWTGTDHAQIGDTYCYTYASSPVFTITGSGELIFNLLDSYYIGENYVGESITPFSVAGSVDGGTPPYTFKKVSGPKWLRVSSDGTISGKPTVTGPNEDLVVRVQDASLTGGKRIRIPVYKTAKRPEKKTVISEIAATSNMAELAVNGKDVVSPTFTVTEGSPSHFETGMGGWYKKVGDDWVMASYGEKFTPGTWEYSCQLRIDEGGEEYVIADGPNVVVDGKVWSSDSSTYAGYDFCYTYGSSPEITILDDSIKIEFNPDDVEYRGTTPYVVYDGTASTPGVIVKNKKGNVIKPSKYTVTYLENAQPGTAYVEITIKASGLKNRAFFKIYMPGTTSTTVANTNDGVKVSWAAVDGAAGYVIYRRAWNLSSTGWTTFERWNNTTDTSWTDTKVYAGTRYQYGVKAYFAPRTDPVSGATIGGAMDNYNLGMVGPLKTTVRITTRTLDSVTAGTKQFTAKWSASSKFTGYQLQYATNSAFTENRKTVTIKDPKTVQKTITGLLSNKTYYVRIRSYQEFNSSTYYGAWSNVKSVKTK